MAIRFNNDVTSQHGDHNANNNILIYTVQIQHTFLKCDLPSKYLILDMRPLGNPYNRELQ